MSWFMHGSIRPSAPAQRCAIDKQHSHARGPVVHFKPLLSCDSICEFMIQLEYIRIAKLPHASAIIDLRPGPGRNCSLRAFAFLASFESMEIAARRFADLAAGSVLPTCGTAAISARRV